MIILYRTQDIKIFMTMCILCPLGPFSLAQSQLFSYSCSLSTELQVVVQVIHASLPEEQYTKG